MNSNVSRNIIRGIIIIIIQVLVLKRIDINIGNFNYLHLFVYPVIMLLLPIRTSKIVMLLIAFGVGLFLDMFYNSPGVHAGSLVLMTYLRTFVLNILKPTEGYALEVVPTINKMGLTWFLTYSGILLFIHHLSYFSLEAFSYVYALEIVLRTIFSFIASFVLMVLFMFITNPKY